MQGLRVQKFTLKSTLHLAYCHKAAKAAMPHWKQQMPSCSLNNMCAMLQYLQKGTADQAGNAGFILNPHPSH